MKHIVFASLLNLPPLVLLGSLSIFVTFIVALCFCKKFDKSTKLFFSYLTLSAIFETIMIIWVVKGENNLWISHIFTPIEYGLLAYLLSYWQENHTIKKLMRYSIPVVIILIISLNLSGIEPTNIFDYISIPITSLLLTAFSWHILHQMSIRDTGNLLKDHKFWITAGVFIYFSSGLFIFAMGILPQIDALYVIFQVNSGLLIIRNIFFSIAMIYQNPVKQRTFTT